MSVTVRSLPDAAATSLPLIEIDDTPAWWDAYWPRQCRRRTRDIEQVDIAAADVREGGTRPVEVAGHAAAEVNPAGPGRELDLCGLEGFV